MQTFTELSDDLDIGYCDNCRKEVISETLLPYEDAFVCEHCMDRLERRNEMRNLRKIEQEGFYDYED